MAAESSQKIDGENPSLSGISHAARAFSLPARRGGPCKQFEAHGLTAYGLFPHKSLQEQAPVRACTKKAQRFALSFKLFAEREAPRNCPYNPLIIKHIHNFELCSYGLCMAKRVLKMAIRCLLFDRRMSTMQLQSSVCQRIGNTVSFFCQHSMHIFIKGRSGPYVSKMTTFCLYMAAGSVV